MNLNIVQSSCPNVISKPKLHATESCHHINVSAKIKFQQTTEKVCQL